LKVLKIVCVGIVWLIGVVAIGVGIVALVDPAGSQMANDSDPFGTPVSRYHSLSTIMAGVGIILIPIGVKKLIRKCREDNSGTHLKN
jgi:hypothetical protein